MDSQYYEITRGFESQADEVATTLGQPFIRELLHKHPNVEWPDHLTAELFKSFQAATAGGPNGAAEWYQRADREIRDRVRILYASHVDRILRENNAEPDLHGQTAKARQRIRGKIRQSILSVGHNAFDLTTGTSWLNTLPPWWNKKNRDAFWRDYLPLTATFMLERIAWAWVHEPSKIAPGNYFTLVTILKQFPVTLFPIMSKVIEKAQRSVSTVRLRLLFNWLTTERTRNVSMDDLYRELSVLIAHELDKRESAES